ncbi:flagellar biosynthetic protein FliO [Bosea lathyri]|uniref:flagellar biosynthetic protein FliO n=1 Tax=Bosea lathyri TaxID=1036778 RepID=UPI001359902C|nr:flagellar biosynthetic protein FliO [Bosea lathyri]
MQSLFGLDLSTAQKVLVASVVILVLLILLGLFVRQIKGGRLRLRGQGSGRTRQPRLGVVDTHDLDRQRQLVLIRRDNVEHLIMIGGASDVVVETNILRSGARATMPMQTDLQAPDRPLPFESLVPTAEPTRLDLIEEPRRAPPSAPIAVTPPAPEMLPPLPHRPVQTQTQAEAAAGVAVGAGVAAALGAARPGYSASPASSAPPPISTAPAPNFARDHAPAPAVSAGELDDMARQLEEALKRPFSAVRQSNATPEPQPRDNAPSPLKPPVEPPKPVVEAPPIEKPAPAQPAAAPSAQIPPAPTVPAPVTPTPTPPAPPVTGGRKTALPVDVEAELEMALGLRPERTGLQTPSPWPIKPPSFAPPERVGEARPVESKPDPIKPEPARDDGDEDDKQLGPAVSEAKEAASEPASETDREEGKLVEKPEPEAKPEPESESKPVSQAASKPEPEVEARSEPKAIDPFSVDAIEAEFARLLGRDPKSKS